MQKARGIQILFSSKDGINLETENKSKFGKKSPNTYTLNVMLLNNTWVKTHISREIRNDSELKVKIQPINIYCMLLKHCLQGNL